MLRRIGKFFRCFLLCFSLNYSRAFFSSRFCLFGHCALHGLRDFDIFHFDQFYLQSPRVSNLIDDFTNRFAYFISIS